MWTLLRKALKKLLWFREEGKTYNWWQRILVFKLYYWVSDKAYEEEDRNV